VSRATLIETLAVTAEVIAPVLARGDHLRRPRVEAGAEQLDLDLRAVLSHFQPRGVLLSHGAERADRRRGTAANHVAHILSKLGVSPPSS
jgi:hypothetical protein